MKEKLQEFYKRILNRFPMGREASYLIGNENPSTVREHLFRISEGKDSDRRYTDAKSGKDALEFIEELDEITERVSENLEKMSKDIKKASKITKNKSKKLKELYKSIPQKTKIMDANADLLDYTSNELNRFIGSNPDKIHIPIPSDIEKPDYKNFFNSMEKLKLPDTALFDGTIMAVATIGTSSLSAATNVVLYYEEIDEDYFNNIPDSYEQLSNTKKLEELLDILDPKLGEIWEDIWNKLAIGDKDSLKNASTNARSMIDEISWRSDYEHLKSLEWCELDDNDKPTRATRFAWIYYGDVLPPGLKNKPSNDQQWKNFNESYGKLQKTIHKIDVKLPVRINSIFKTLEIGLVNYLEAGMGRLKMRYK